MSTHTDFPKIFTTLMIASYFGLRAVVERLLQLDGIDLNLKDSTYQRSALSWAAGNGFDVIVKSNSAIVCSLEWARSYCQAAA